MSAGWGIVVGGGQKGVIRRGGPVGSGPGIVQQLWRFVLKWRSRVGVGAVEAPYQRGRELALSGVSSHSSPMGGDMAHYPGNGVHLCAVGLARSGLDLLLGETLQAALELR